MFKRSLINRAVFGALLLPGTVLAEVEVSGYIKNETSVFTSSGQVTGEAKTMLDDSGHDSGDLLKFENSARMFVNGDLGENSSWHAEINAIYDTEGVNSDYKGHVNYTQHDWLRELYADTSFGGWDFRLGKQQVVWGTADGIKLLDIINPTDYRELVQNTMEDSRIPIWMLKAERNIGNSGNIQFIVSQVEENKIPGLNKNGDSGHPFIMKGVDTITGRVNGFLNIGPALSRVANTFDTLAVGGVGAAGLTAFAGAGTSVNGFSTNAGGAHLGFAGACQFLGLPAGNTSSECLDHIAQNPTALGIPSANSNNYKTNLIDKQSAVGGTSASPEWSVEDPNSTFEYMGTTSFATFDQYAAGGGMVSKYKTDRPDDLDLNLGARVRFSTDSGINYSVNYTYNYDPNPSVSVQIHDPGGNKVNSNVVSMGADRITVLTDAAGNQPCSAAARRGAGLGGASAGAFTGSTDPCTMVFKEELHRIHSLGGSMDMAIDSLGVPVVLRFEGLYQKDVRSPVIDRTRLGVGDVVNGLKSEKGDFFKYVVGADVTVLTNLLVSGQFIQFRNLDFVDEKKDTISGAACTTANCGRYTADPATLHLDNGLQKGWENKEFYSLFLSKPFGPSDEHRWNNIIMFEEGGGWWNRFDMEYSFSDNLIGTAELNQYWGDEDTQFGQFKDSSNVQLGIRYLFD